MVARQIAQLLINGALKRVGEHKVRPYILFVTSPDYAPKPHIEMETPTTKTRASRTCEGAQMSVNSIPDRVYQN